MGRSRDSETALAHRDAGGGKETAVPKSRSHEALDVPGGASWQQMLEVLEKNRRHLASQFVDRDKKGDSEKREREREKLKAAKQRAKEMAKEREKLDKQRIKEQELKEKMKSEKEEGRSKGHRKTRSISKKAASFSDMLRVVSRPTKARKYAAVRPIFDLTGLREVKADGDALRSSEGKHFLDTPAPLEESKRFHIVCKACLLQLEVASDLDLWRHVKNGNHGPIWSSKFREMLLKSDKDIRRFAKYYIECIVTEREAAESKSRAAAAIKAQRSFARRNGSRNSSSSSGMTVPGTGSSSADSLRSASAGAPLSPAQTASLNAADKDLATFLFILEAAARDWSLFQMQLDDSGRVALNRFAEVQREAFAALTPSILSWNIKSAHRLVMQDIKDSLEDARVPFVAVTCTGWTMQEHASAPLGGHRYVKCRIHYWSRKWRMRSVLVACNYVADVHENARTIQRIQLETIQGHVLPDHCKIAVCTSDLDESRFGVEPNHPESSSQCVLLGLELAIKQWLTAGELPGLNVPFSMRYLIDTVRVILTSVTLSHHTRMSLGIEQATLLPEIPDVVVAPHGSCWSLVFDMLYGFLKNIDAINDAVDQLRLLDDLSEARADVARELLLGDKRLAARYLRDVVLVMKVIKSALANLVPEVAGSPALVLYPTAAVVPRFVHALQEGLMDFFKASPAAASAPVFGGELLAAVEARLGRFVCSAGKRCHASLQHQPRVLQPAFGPDNSWRTSAAALPSVAASAETQSAACASYTLVVPQPPRTSRTRLPTLLNEHETVPIALRAAMLHPSEFSLPWLSREMRDVVRTAVLEDCEKLFSGSDLALVERELRSFWSKYEPLQDSVAPHHEFWRHQRKYTLAPLLAQLYLSARATTRPVVNLVSAEFRARDATRLHGATHAHMLSDNLDDWEKSEVLKHWAIGKSALQMEQAFARWAS